MEAECEACLGEARQLAPGSPEPLQALASLRQQQGKDEEALALLRQSLALWFKPTPDSEDEDEGEEEAAEGAGTGKQAAAADGSSGKQAAAAAAAEDAGEEDLGSQDTASGSEEGEGMEWESEEEEELPSYEFRFETAKLLLELDDSVDAASQVGAVCGWVGVGGGGGRQCVRM